ncbi:MAG: TetR family transcriptional regulator [Mycobacterium sp.]|nr:TetR family transcriptional regulator [Mycobacterium sp.]
MSISNDESLGDRILDAAAACVLAYGIDRVTLAEIARRAGVSRPTVYRRWPDTPSILAALLTSRVTRVLEDAGDREAGREALVARIVTVAERLQHDEIVMSVLHSAPELAMVYIAERLGTSQQILIDATAAEIELAQEHGSVRAGDPRRLAAMCLLITQSTVQSAQMGAGWPRCACSSPSRPCNPRRWSSPSSAPPTWPPSSPTP